jgi:hypothetical protein
MIKTNQEFAVVLAAKASREGGLSVFKDLGADGEAAVGVEVSAPDRPLVVAGLADHPEYCVSETAVWRRQTGMGAKKLFPLHSVVAAHWMRSNLWQQLERVEEDQREAWTVEVKTNEWSNVDVELDSGERILLPRAGSWLLRFLDRCARYNYDRRTNEQDGDRA